MTRARNTEVRSSTTMKNRNRSAEHYIDKLNKSGEFRSPIVTRLEPADKFYPAEEYHQDYYRWNPNAGYCKFVVREKVQKFNSVFGDKRKDTTE